MEADAEEKDKLKEQVESYNKEYEACLTKLQEVNKEMQAVSQRMNQMVGSDIAPEIRKLAEQSIAKINEIQSSAQDMEETKKILSEKFLASSETMHKECVKVYRNIQAVIVEENGKQTENIAENINKITFKVNITLAVSAAALVTGVASLALALFFLV